MQLEQIKEQINDTRTLINSSLSLLHTDSAQIARFMLDQDEALLQTLQEEFRSTIIQQIGVLIPMGISTAEELIDHIYGAQFRGTVNPFEIAEHFNIEVRREKLIDGSIGRSMFDGERLSISYHPTREYRDRFTVAHELGHIFLHFAKGLDYVFTDKLEDMLDKDEEETENNQPLMAAARYGAEEDHHYENEANTFAAELMVPKKSLQYFLSMVPSGKTVKLTLMREHFKASKPVLLTAVHNYHLPESGKIINNIDTKDWQ